MACIIQSTFCKALQGQSEVYPRSTSPLDGWKTEYGKWILFYLFRFHKTKSFWREKESTFRFLFAKEECFWCLLLAFKLFLRINLCRYNFAGWEKLETKGKKALISRAVCGVIEWRIYVKTSFFSSGRKKREKIEAKVFLNFNEGIHRSVKFFYLGFFS